jgi:hypothetical protein
VPFAELGLSFADIGAVEFKRPPIVVTKTALMSNRRPSNAFFVHRPKAEQATQSLGASP